MIHIDLFSGIGGFSGLQEAGFNFSKVYFSEIDKHCIANYKYHFKNSIYAGDIKSISGRELKRENPGEEFIITFGFPCQDLSVAGRGEGFNGTRSVLFFEAMRLVQELEPAIFIFENVKGLLSNNEGKTFEVVLGTIADIGIYECEWQLVNTRWLLPQNRERVYFIGHLGGKSRPKVFPITETSIGINERESKTSIVRTISGGGHSGGHHSGMTIIQVNNNKDWDGKSTRQINKVYDPIGIMPCLTSHRLEGKCNIVIPVLTPDRLEKRQNGRRFKNNSDDSFTLNTQDRHGVMIDDTIRRLTEIECERLQGFEDDWTKYGDYNGVIKEIPQTARYRMLGNAITKSMVKLIGQKLLE